MKSIRSQVDMGFLVKILIAIIIVIVVTVLIIKGKDIVLNSNEGYDNVIEEKTGITIGEETQIKEYSSPILIEHESLPIV